MAEIVETDFFQSVVFQYNLEMLGDEVWFDKFAHCIYIDIIQGLHQLSSFLPPFPFVFLDFMMQEPVVF